MYDPAAADDNQSAVLPPASPHQSQKKREKSAIRLRDARRDDKKLFFPLRVSLSGRRRKMIKILWNFFRPDMANDARKRLGINRNIKRAKGNFSHEISKHKQNHVFRARFPLRQNVAWNFCRHYVNRGDFSLHRSLVPFVGSDGGKKGPKKPSTKNSTKKTFSPRVDALG
jgi:hypothetical protein